MFPLNQYKSAAIGQSKSGIICAVRDKPTESCERKIEPGVGHMEQPLRKQMVEVNDNDGPFAFCAVARVGEECCRRAPESEGLLIPKEHVPSRQEEKVVPSAKIAPSATA
jgi:hypothetical protein